MIKRIYNIFAEAIECILKMNINSTEYTQIFAKVFGKGIGCDVKRGLPPQLIENNGVFKEILPSTVSTTFCDKLEKYYCQSKQEGKKENLIFMIYCLDKVLKGISDTSMCIEKSIEELMPLNTNAKKTQISLFPRVNCKWEHKSQGRCYKNNLEVFIQNFFYVEWKCIKGTKLHHYIISPLFSTKSEKKRDLKIAAAPITDKDILESEPYQRDGNNYFHIKSLKDENLVKDSMKSVIENTVAKKADILLFPEMLGNESMIKEIQSTCNFGTAPLLVVWPSVWKNTKDNIENSNTSIITLHKGKNVLEICRQNKKNSYVTPDNVIEDLAPQESWDINILSCEGIGRIGILICKDFLIDDNRKLLCDTLKTTLILVPSYTTGEHNFEILLSQRFQNDCNIAWCNTCSAATITGAKIENFNTIAAITSYGVRINSIAECVHRYDGVACCTNKNCKDCVFIGEIPFA